jgi:hypothetical protein
MAAMCSTWLSRRFPAQGSRCRIWSPDETSSGAVPVQDAKWLWVALSVFAQVATTVTTGSAHYRIPIVSADPTVGHGVAADLRIRGR